MKENLRKFLKDNGLFSYSGRGMYGKKCCAVHVEDLKDLDNLLEKGDNVETLREYSWDRLGMGYVIYWQWLEWEVEI